MRASTLYYIDTPVVKPAQVTPMRIGYQGWKETRTRRINANVWKSIVDVTLTVCGFAVVVMFLLFTSIAS